MDTVGGNVRGKRAVCVVEQIVALKIEDRLAVGEGLSIIIEVIKICVIHRGTARILRCGNVKVRHDVDYRVRLKIADLINKIAVGLLERLDRAADIVYAEHDIYLAELACFAAVQEAWSCRLRKRRRLCSLRLSG